MKNVVKSGESVSMFRQVQLYGEFFVSLQWEERGSARVCKELEFSHIATKFRAKYTYVFYLP